MSGAVESRVPAGAKELLRAAAALVLVMGGATAALAALDAAPAWLKGEPLGVRRLSGVDEVERRLRARLYLPAFFPDHYRWPPSSVRLLPGHPASVALGFEAREGGLALLLGQTVGGEGAVSPRVLPRAEMLQSSPVRLGDGEAKLARVVGEDGAVWDEVSWHQGGRTLVMRGKAGVDELLRMARSSYREGP